MLLDVALAATVLFAAAWVATWCLRSASADVRRTIWRAAFTGVAALPILLSFDPPQAAAPFVAVATAPAAVSAAAEAAADVPWLLAIWAVGCVFVLGRLTVGLALVHRWGRRAFRGDRADFSPAVLVPMTWGVLRPQILLPEDARTWRGDTRELVMRHEAAHVASRDWAWQTIARIVTAALWFHPLAWVADRCLRQEAECAADDAVLASGADPAGYADELVRVARSLSSMTPTRIAAVGMVERSSFEQRVRHVLNPNAGRSPAGWRLRSLVALVVAGFVVSAAAFSVSASAPQERTVYRLGSGITDPKVVKEVRPQYSKEALEKKIQGEVLLEGVVTEEGRMTDLRILKSLEPSLDKAAIEAALQWEFEPARKDGEPVSVWVTLALSFRVK
jgi:TonB family protein